MSAGSPGMRPVKNKVYKRIWVMYSAFVAFLWLLSFSHRSTHHPVSDACSLSLAIVGITSEAARSFEFGDTPSQSGAVK